MTDENTGRELVENNPTGKKASRKRESLETEVPKVHDNPYQPRLLYDEKRVQVLAHSIMRQGLLVPITVRPHPDIEGEYQCASGHMRLRAFKYLGYSHIPAFIEDLDDVQMMEHCITENLQRQDLNPLEEARGYQTLVESGKTHHEIAMLAGKDRSVISNRLRLLDMEPFLQECVLCGTLEPSKTLIISTLPPGFNQYTLADLSMDWSFTHRELKKHVKDIKRGERTISWVREVPVDALREWPSESSRPHRSGDVEEPLEPVLVLMPGYVVDFRISLGNLKRLNCTKVKAEMVYMVEWLRGREEDSTPERASRVRIDEETICPELSYEGHRKIRLLCERLNTHGRRYPVGVIVVNMPA